MLLSPRLRAFMPEAQISFKHFLSGAIRILVVCPLETVWFTFLKPRIQARFYSTDQARADRARTPQQ